MCKQAITCFDKLLTCLIATAHTTVLRLSIVTQQIQLFSCTPVKRKVFAPPYKLLGIKARQTYQLCDNSGPRTLSNFKCEIRHEIVYFYICNIRFLLQKHRSVKVARQEKYLDLSNKRSRVRCVWIYTWCQTFLHINGCLAAWQRRIRRFRHCYNWRQGYIFEVFDEIQRINCEEIIKVSRGLHPLPLLISGHPKIT